MRLFVALLLEEEPKETLWQMAQQLKGEALQGNITRRENLHLTLAFLGETERKEDICRAMDQVGGREFAMTFDRMGKFRRDGGDLYWAGVSHCPPLLAVQRRLSRALKAQGFALEEREFRPHLTLGRQVILSPEAEERTLAERFFPVTTQVRAITLMKSERVGGKLTYTPIYERPLEG